MIPTSLRSHFFGLAFVAGIAGLGLVACSGGSSTGSDGAVGDDDDDDDDDIVIDAAPDAPPALAPALRNVVALPDDELALQALQLIGGPVPDAVRNCNACHGLSRTKLRTWETLSNNALSTCLVDLQVSNADSAAQMIECLRTDPSDSTSPFTPSHLGVYSAAAGLDWFDFTFHRAYGEGGDAAYAVFKDRVLMPRGDHPAFNQGQFDIVAEWFARGLPLLEDLVPADVGPGDCIETTIGEGVATHVAAMATEGWDEVNEANGILMFGCAGAETPRDCLGDLPRAGAEAFSVGWEVIEGSVLRILRRVNYQSAYWTRSSADGRFVGHGRQSGPYNSMILDMETGAAIPTTAFYDPGFFPDNSAFAFQGSGTKLCDQALLTSQPETIDYSEPECTGSVNVSLYQHLGAALDGGDYWTVAGLFESDDGGHFLTLGDPNAPFGNNSQLELTALIHDGNAFTADDLIIVDVPNEGDTVISPSARLLMSRVSSGGNGQAGFVLRRLDATKGPEGYEVEIPEIARYCVNGGKPGFSFDERWVAYHHYISNTDADAIELGFTDAKDPGFAPYLEQGTANVFLLDLLTGDRTRVTNMQPGQYALFPHFRSDGWIYIEVRDGETEYVVASDAALVVGG